MASTSGLLYHVSTRFFRYVGVRDRSTRRRGGRRRQRRMLLMVARVWVWRRMKLRMTRMTCVRVFVRMRLTISDGISTMNACNPARRSRSVCRPGSSFIVLWIWHRSQSRWTISRVDIQPLHHPAQPESHVTLPLLLFGELASVLPILVLDFLVPLESSSFLGAVVGPVRVRGICRCAGLRLAGLIVRLSLRSGLRVRDWWSRKKSNARADVWDRDRNRMQGAVD